MVYTPRMCRELRAIEENPYVLNATGWSVGISLPFLGSLNSPVYVPMYFIVNYIP